MIENNLLAQINNAFHGSGTQSSINEFLNSYLSNLPEWKALSIFLTVFFLSSTLFFWIKTGWIQLRIDRTEDVILRKNLPKRRSTKGWQHVQKHFFKGDDNSLKIALIEADKMLDDVLKTAGFKGEDIGDRLKKVTETQLPNLDEIWEAHKLRNRLVHETDFKLNRDTAERALGVYERTFKDLGLLD